ncbi:MAG: methyltransferase domain-containing protein [Pseudomonadota bacterium]
MSYRTYFMHGLKRVGLEKAVVLYWKMLGRPTDYLTGSRAERFRTIYRNKRWSGDREDRPSLSGSGSTLPATQNLRAALPAFLTEVGAKSLLDAGCGDYYWMRTVELPCGYIGADIVDTVIAANQNAFGDATHQFVCIDGAAEPLPEADVVMCREVLFHLSLADGAALLANIRRTGARYLLATTEPRVRFNPDIPTGAFREINLANAPYRLGEPFRTLPDGDGINPNRVMGVWKLD